MKRFAYVFSILLLLFSLDANAKSKHGGFNLYGKFVLVVEEGSQGEAARAVIGWLDSLGCRKYSVGESCDDDIPCFIIRRTPIQTATGRNVFMNVSADGVSVDYNGHATVNDITDNIERHLVVRKNKRGIIKEAYLTETSVSERMPSLFIDLSSKSTDAKSLRAQIKKAAKGDYDKIYLMVFTNTGAGVKNNTFNQTATQNNTFMRVHALTSEQLSSVIAEEKEAEPIVMINLFNDNRHFREVTGHPLFSDEGMRFVDDFMKGLFYRKNIPSCQLNIVCSDEERERFVEPLVRRIEETGTKVEYNIINN